MPSGNVSFLRGNYSHFGTYFTAVSGGERPKLEIRSIMDSQKSFHVENIIMSYGIAEFLKIFMQFFFRSNNQYFICPSNIFQYIYNI